MNGRRLWAVLVVLIPIAAAVMVSGRAAAQGARENGVDIPGFGHVNPSELPPNAREAIRRRGRPEDEPSQQYGDLPSVPLEDDIPVAMPQEERGGDASSRQASAPVQGSPPTKTRSREEALKRMYDERAFPNDEIPEGAYERAWKQIQQMPAAEPPVPETPPAPQSRSEGARRWAWLWNALPTVAAAAEAQSTPWLQIGPAPFTARGGAEAATAGLIGAVAVNPSDSQRVYLGSYGGGLWQTSDGGTTWVTTTDRQPSLQIESVAVHPTNPNVIFLGTGKLDQVVLAKKASMLRATDGGATVASWCQIGPYYGNPSYVAVLWIAVDNTKTPIRVWAATSAGLWYSDNAADPSTFTNCPAADGTCSGCGAVTWTRVTSLDRHPGTPDQVTHIFVSSWNDAPNNKNTLLASIHDGPSPGWYRSADCACWNRGSQPNCPGTCTWSSANGSGGTGLPPGHNPNQAAIAKTPDPPNVVGTDVVFALIDGISSPSCGTDATATRLYKGLISDTSATWNLVTATKNCVTAADCCENPPGGCNCSDNGTPVPSCPVGHTCACSPAPDCDGLRGVEIDPTTANTVALGGAQLYRSTSGGSDRSFMQYGRGVLHDDKNGMKFDPNNHNVLWVGTDGGIWKSPNFGNPIQTPTWNDLNNQGLANIEFYAGGVDTLNYGVSVGGTQDNGDIKGGDPLLWSQIFGGDSVGAIIDPMNSNVAYLTTDGVIDKTTDGGLNFPPSVTGLPTPVSIPARSLTMSPSDNKTLVVYSNTGNRVYRSTDAAANWTSIATSTLPPLVSLAIAPSQPNLVFGANGGDPCGTGVWRTTEATNWTNSTAGLPFRCLTSIVIDQSNPCTSTSCTLYVTASGFDEDTPMVPGHVFVSTDAGQHWTNISATPLPNIPANKIVIHPSCPNTLYVGTDMGIFQGKHNDGTCGTVNNSTWTWGTFANGFPQAALVNDLSVHPDAGLLRAWTFGRSLWEVQTFPIWRPDQNVNTIAPQSAALSPRITSGNTGQNYGVAWIDDRVAMNNWHPYYRGYMYYANGNPLAMGSDVKVDDGSVHAAQGVAMSGHPTQANLPYYDSLVAWYDDRVNPLVSQHVYFTYVGSDGFKPWPDLRADTTSVNATNPAITWQQNLSCALAWQADRGDGNHDIYARFFGVDGGAKGPQQMVNTTTSDATAPAAVSDYNSNVFIAWSEFETTTQTGRVMISKYTRDGVRLAGPVPVDSTQVPAGTTRNDVALAVDGFGNVIAGWWEATGTSSETVFRRRLTNALAYWDTEQKKVGQPPSFPIGVDRTLRPSVAVDSSNNFVIAWQGTVNAPDARTSNGLGASFDSSGAQLKNDFRIDLHGRALAGPTRATRSSFAGQFAYAWRDNRSGKFQVYTRAVPSLQ